MTKTVIIHPIRFSTTDPTCDEFYPPYTLFTRCNHKVYCVWGRFTFLPSKLKIVYSDSCSIIDDFPVGVRVSYESKEC